MRGTKGNVKERGPGSEHSNIVIARFIPAAQRAAAPRRLPGLDLALGPSRVICSSA